MMGLLASIGLPADPMFWGAFWEAMYNDLFRVFNWARLFGLNWAIYSIHLAILDGMPSPAPTQD